VTEGIVPQHADSQPKTQMQRQSRPTAHLTRRWTLAAVIGIATVGGAFRSVTTNRAPGCADDNAGLTLPVGFCASIFAEGLGGPRHMSVAPNGDLFVNRQNRARGDTVQGGVLVMRDTNRDGKADLITRFGPTGGTGVALAGNFVYVDAKSAILRYPIAAGAMLPSGSADTIVSGMPGGGHAARNFVLDGKGNLFVNIGSMTNSCQEQDRKTGVKGVDPCVELETRAGIWKFSATQVGQKFSAAERFSTGIRNAVGLAWHAGEGKLYSTQHGRDQLLQNWAPMYDEAKSADQPAEEFMQVNSGDDFGWPYCYFDTELKRLVMAPEYGGNAQDAGRCTTKKLPLATFPGHWAPNALTFYTGRTFPARFRDGAFIAFHGSWNRAPRPQAGYTIVFVPATKGKYSGQYETFADNFANGKLDPSRAEHRPTGLATAADGAMFVSDDKGGRIYRIQYVGTK